MWYQKRTNLSFILSLVEGASENRRPVENTNDNILVMECKGWHQEAALRMLRNNLHPDVAERPDDLVVYGGSGKAARNPACLAAIIRELQRLENDETLLVQSGKPVGVFRTHD